MKDVKLTINDQAVVAKSGQTILQAARAAGVDIPTLCDHPALAARGGCRMCLVEVKGMRGLQTSCTCPATDGMVVTTESEQLAQVRRFVLEMLFSERNHYCMYCQMSGDCDLQRLAYRYGVDHWPYSRPYDKMKVDATRKYFIMDHNRCILCSRCVRACSEVAANHTLGLRGRGGETMVIADLDVPFGQSSCVECGTCLQVCPTGALVDAHSAYGGREKDVTHTQTTCTQCSVGCALDVVTRSNRVLRVDGVWDAEPSQGLLCVDGRFKPLYDKRERITKPLVRKDGALAEASWDEALDLVAGQLKGGTALGLAASATTNEALAAFAELFQKVGGKAGRLEPAAPKLGFGQPAQVKDILEADYVIVAGADPLAYQRVVGYFVKRAADQGVPLAFVGETQGELAGLARMSVGYGETAQVVADAANAALPVVIYSVGLPEEAANALKGLADKGRFLALDPARNGKGAESAGLQPQSPNGAALHYILLGEQSESPDLVAQLGDTFTVVQASYRSSLVERADVVLPAPIWTERSGHVTNLEGKVLALQAALPLPEGVRDEAEVLATLMERV